MSKVEVKNLKKLYGNFEALKGINLTVEPGQLVVLLGPTGAGKTTLLKCIAGLEEPSSGSILLDGIDVTHVPAWKRDVAMFFQSYALYPHLSVYDNIAYPLRERKTPENEIKTLVENVAQKLRISHLLSRRDPSTLSGGEMQRVALARTLVRKPRVFLLDEPISNLDAKLREEMRAEFKRIHRELNQTIIYATPDFLEAFAIAEKVAVINDGKLIQFDTPFAVFRRPVNRFVATFIGSPPINIIEGVVQLKNGHWHFVSPVLNVDLANIKLDTSSIMDNMPMELAFRPHDVTHNYSSNSITIKGKVVAVEKLGHQTIITFNTHDAYLKMVYRGVAPYKHGDEITVTVDTDKLLLIEPREGNVINV